MSFSSRTSALPNTCDLFIYAKTHIKMSDLDDIKEKIRAAMNSQGTYTSDLDLCITLCAGSYIAFKIALNDIAKKKRSFVTEVSREGNKKLVAHPAFKDLMRSKLLANSCGNLAWHYKLCPRLTMTR